MAAFMDDKPLVAGINEDWDEQTTGRQIMRPEWDFSPICMQTMHHLPHIFFDTLRPERPDCPVLIPSSFARTRDRVISQDIYGYEPCGLPTGNFMPAEQAQIRLMTASPITLRSCIPAPDQVTPEQAYFKDLDFYKKTLFHTPFLSRGRAVTLLEYRDAKFVFEVDDWFRTLISVKGYKYILVVCDYFTKYMEAYPLKDKTARSVTDALMDIWLPRYGFPLFLHSDQGKEFDNAMIHKLSELLGTVKTKTTPYHPRSDGLVERFNRTLLAMLAMFVSQEHDNWDDLLPFMMLAYNTTVHTTTGFTPYRLVFGDECNLPGNLVHRELCADPPPGDPGTYASWVKQALFESYDEVRAQQQCATHRQKRNYDSKAVARAFPIGCWTLRYYPPARKNKLCSPWIGPYKIVRGPMEWVVGIQLDADARIVYVHMDDLKRCATPDPEPTWPDTARGTSVVVSTRAPSTLALSDTTRSQNHPNITSQRPRSSAHHTKSISSGYIDVRAPTNDENIVKIDTVPDSIVKTDTVPTSTWDLQDAKCILSMKSDCSIDVKGYRFFTMERLFYALQLLSLGDRKLIGQLAKYSRMDYVRKCVNTRFELASSTLQDKWLDEQFQTWIQIITARILSDPVFKQALLDSAGSPLCDPEDSVYATALTSSSKMCVQRKLLTWPSWITLPTRVTRGQVLA